MQSILKYSSQTLAILFLGIVVSAGLTYYIPKTKKEHTELHELVNDSGGVAFFSEKTVHNPENEGHNPDETGVASADAATPSVNINVAPPHDASQKFVKVGELGAFMKEARIVRKAFKMADLKAATGLTEEQILKIENGQAMPTPDIANELETVLKIEVKFK
jgi:predicted lipid-binding transport protein (Tim44 family)